MKDDLIQRLQNWDGKHTDYLIAVYRDHLDEDSFFVQLVDLCLTHPETQIPGTWIIKHHYDQKESLDDDLMNHLLREGNQFSDWETRLHLLQILPKVKMEQETVPYVEEWVRKGLKDDNKFVRAWSYQGLYEVAKHIPEMKKELRLLCEDALQLESASVQARVRKVVKQLEK
jgi:hypothetical protein